MIIGLIISRIRHYREKAKRAIPANSYHFGFISTFITILLSLNMQKPKTKSRFQFIPPGLKGRETPSTASASPHENQLSHIVDKDYNDKQLVEKRYLKAVDELKEAIKIRKGPWESFNFEDLSNEPEGVDDSQFKNKINTVLLSHQASIKDRKGWSKLMYAVECVFTAISPLVKNLLLATQGAQSVILSLPIRLVHYLICRCLY